MSKILVVTSFSNTGYEQYGKKFLESFQANWPIGPELHLAVYHHTVYPLPDKLWRPEFVSNDFVTYTNLDDLEGIIPVKDAFMEMFAKRFKPQEGTPIPWQLDVPKFCNKVFALAHANISKGGDYDWIIWLDADTVTDKPLTLDFLNGLLDDKADVIRLGRTSVPYSETSFVAFHGGPLDNPRGRALIEQLVLTYVNGEYQFYSEWHDGFIFERILNTMINSGTPVKNLTPKVEGLDAFGASPLAEYMHHDKGNKKEGGGALTTATKTTNKKSMTNPYIDKDKQLSKVHPAAQPFVVHPVDCVASQELKDNIMANVTEIKRWISFGRKVPGSKVMFCSGGPSLVKFIPEIKEAVAQGARVACVKHSLPTLLEWGVVPDFCVILDPRDVDGVSTHGKIRKNLLEKAGDKTVFLVASMTHPSVAKYLHSKKFKVVGWHAGSGELTELVQEQKLPSLEAISIGTCSAVRGIKLMDYLGFETITLVGFDGSMYHKPENLEEKTDSGKQKYLQAWLPPGLDTQIQIKAINIPEGASPIGGRFFWTTGELVALYQDLIGLISLFKQREVEDQFFINVLLDKNTLVGEGWRRLMANIKRQEAEKKLFLERREKSPTYLEILDMV